ncbi:hypothetical protein COU19_00390 [Candidatus Kaiserbacteria bacterium CG10_big_fil_rev_8_21_14_0_10_56_12]|uniref:Polysaccharide pyruvyl transferase domain-containing protein n=1 Tax=Candidatus Kaiserbacteria bacterium CG10_big_fil_rev_8_21_14_0_10_56_12 TaxID=1974611 RepID=A0A2H0UCA6_9BACT|nr:MAG: hypothetical protein COU19_00390 [Candidatus Kaiserbacteria bacterium CG10_big_fil_rev_8_21_14_0_10_56_12]
MKLTIAGASVYGLNNTSDDSMLQSFLGGMRSAVPDLEVTLVCRHPGTEVEKMFGVQSIQNLDFPTKAESANKRFHGFNIGDTTDHLRTLYREIEGSTALMIGGDPFDDSNSDMIQQPFRGIMPYVVNLITLAKYLQKKIILHGVHLGRPPTSAYGTALTQFCLDNADLVTTREDATKQELCDTYGAPPDRIVTSADSGFALLSYTKPAPSPQLQKLFADHGLEAKKYIVVTIRSYYWLWDADTTIAYAKKFADYLDRLALACHCPIVLVPHCAYELDAHWESDINFQHEIYQQSKKKEALVPVSFYLTSEDLLYCIEHARYVISNRRHSGIYAALLATPFYLFGERKHVGAVYDSLGLSSEQFVEVSSLDTLFSERTLRTVLDTLMAWDVEGTRSAALAQAKKCRYATEAVSALLES